MNKVDATMTEINEQRELAEEISNAISNPLNAGLDIDEVSSAYLCMCMCGRANTLPQTPARRTNSKRSSRSSSKTDSTSDSWAHNMHQFTPRRVPATSRHAIRRQRRPRMRNSRNCKLLSPCRDELVWWQTPTSLHLFLSSFINL